MQTQRRNTHPGPSRWDGTPDMRYKKNRVWCATLTKAVHVGEPKTIQFGFKLNTGRLQFTGNGLNIGTWFSLARTNSNISCGVCQIYGVAALNAIAHIPGLPRQIAVDGVRAALRYHKNGFGIGCISNNNEYKFINDILDELSDSKSEWRRNPNSGNLIRVWTFHN